MNTLKTRISKPITDLQDQYDVIVIGSGYGGSIAASRMARAGRKVCLLEKGKEIRPGDYPRNEVQALKEFQIDQKGGHVGKETNLYDLRVNQEIHVFKGCGLGGTSLINANVSLAPDERIFADTCWPTALRNDLQSFRDGVDRAREILQPTEYPEGKDGYPILPKVNAQRRSAEATGGKFMFTPINVRFEDGKNAVGVEQKKCNSCGDCCTGCNEGAKNTTLMNYLPDAVNHGAEIFTEIAVSHVSQAPDGKWLVHYRTLNVGAEKFGDALQFIKADMVFLGAGSLGSTEILLRSKKEGLGVSKQLGKHFSGNGDFLGFAYNSDAPIQGIGLGINPAGGKIKGSGPCIASVVDLRDQPNVNDGVVIEEGVIPGGLGKLLVRGLVPFSRLIGIDTDRGFWDFIREKRRAFSSFFGGPYKGAIHNTQTFLVMAHDDSNGEMELDGEHHDRLKINWPNLGKQGVFKKIDGHLNKATGALGGTFITNPAWNKLVKYDLVTVHPIGGCVMADNGATGVVNHKGQVFRSDYSDEVYPGLVVCDGAIIPRSLGVNPLLTISGFAERNCKLIAEENNWTIDYTLGKPLHIEEKKQKPGVRFTESMNGYVSLASDEVPDFKPAYEKGQDDNHACGFVLTIYIKDIERYVNGADTEAEMTGTVKCGLLSQEDISVKDASFRLFTNDAENVATKKMIYRMTLVTAEGPTYYFEGIKIMHDDPGFDMWDDTTTLYVTIYEDASKAKEVAKGILKIKVNDFRKQLTTIEVTNASSMAERVKWQFEFTKYFTANLAEVYGGIFRKETLFNPDDKPRQRRPLNAPGPELFDFNALDGVPLTLTRYKGGDRGPVMLVHGLGVSSDIFSVDTIPTNLVEFLCTAGFDVWLIDNRVSIKHPSASHSSSGDDIARLDYPPAIDLIRNTTGKDKVHVIAHCYGATTFAMALLNNMEGVGSVVFSQIGPHVHPYKTNELKTKFHLTGLLDKLGIETLTAYTGTDDSWQGKVFNQLLRLYPYDREDKTTDAVSNRITFLYGQLYELDQMNQPTFDALHELFGVAHIDSFKHLEKMMGAEKVVDASGEDVYMSNLKAGMAIPITFIHGAENSCYLPISTEESFEALKTLNPEVPYRRHVIPNYGHIDCIFGKNAATDVYPHILDHLEQLN